MVADGRGQRHLPLGWLQAKLSVTRGCQSPESLSPLADALPADHAAHPADRRVARALLLPADPASAAGPQPHCVPGTSGMCNAGPVGRGALQSLPPGGPWIRRAGGHLPEACGAA